jgi:hypothetical protein
MDIVSWVLLAIGGVAAAVVTHIASDEICVRLSPLAVRLICSAAKKLPACDCARYREEWLAHLNECPGTVAKLLHATECFICARQLKRLFSKAPVRIIIDGQAVALDIPTAVAAIAAIGKAFLNSGKRADDPAVVYWKDAAEKILDLAEHCSPSGERSIEQTAAFIGLLSRAIERKRDEYELHIQIRTLTQ